MHGRGIWKTTQTREDNPIRARSHKQMKGPTAGEGLPRNSSLSTVRIPLRLQSNVDKLLEGRVPEKEPGTEPGDSSTQATHRSVCILKTRGEGAKKIRKVAKAF